MRASLPPLAIGILLLTSCAPPNPGALAFGAPAGRPCEVFGPSDDDTATAATAADRTTEVVRGEFRVPDVLAAGPVDTLFLWIRYDSTGAFASLSLSSRHDRWFDAVGSPSAATAAAQTRRRGVDAAALYDELREQFVESATPRLSANFLLVTGSGGGLLPANIEWACAPLLANRPLIVRYLENVSTLRRDLITQPRTARLHIFVDQAGRPVTIRLHSGTGFPELDEALVRVGEQTEFEPALYGGFPIPVWVSQAFTVAPAPPRIEGESSARVPRQP